MAISRSVPAVFAAGVVAATAVALTVTAAPAWAGGPSGEVDTAETARAVGSGVLDGVIVGYTAFGSSIEETEAAVIAQCQSAGAQECTSDEAASGGPLCIVSVAAADGVVAGGAGATIEEAVQDANENSEELNLDLEPGPTIVASSCA